MKIIQPEQEIEACDRCHRDAYLQECLVCGKMYCLSCQSVIAGCWVKPRVGMCCQDREDVLAIVKSAADEITPIVQRRRAELKGLRKGK